MSDDGGVVSRRQEALYDMIGTVVLGTEKVEVKEEDQEMEVVDVNEAAVSSDFGPQVFEAMRKVREAMYLVGSFQNAYFL